MGSVSSHTSDEFRKLAHGCIAIIARVPSNEANNAVAAYSGFWVQIDEVHFLITASHVIEGDRDDGPLNEVEETHADATFTLRPAVGDRASETPFNYRHARFFTPQRLQACLPELTDEAREVMLSMDVGAIVLNELYVANLRATGASPYSFNQIKGLTDEQAEALLEPDTLLSAYVVGVPKRMSMVHERTLMFECHYLSLPLYPVGIENRSIVWEPTWPADEVPHDVAGCSGGPVIVTGLDEPFIAGVEYAQERTPQGLVIKSADVTPFMAFLEMWAKDATAPK